MEMVMSGSNRHLRAVKGLADIISRLGGSKSRSPLNYIRTDFGAKILSALVATTSACRARKEKAKIWGIMKKVWVGKSGWPARNFASNSWSQLPFRCT